jgi:predicted transcriptional regulator
MKAHYFKQNTIVVISYNCNIIAEISAAEKLIDQLVDSGYNLAETVAGMYIHTLKYVKQ